MKLIIFITGILLAIWVGFTVYQPVDEFVIGIKKVYLQSKAIERTVTQKSWTSINTIADAYKEISRVFGIKVAEETAKNEVKTTTPAWQRDPIEQLFEHNIALWISIFAGFTTMSLYLNTLSFLGFFLKPITWLIKK